MKNKDLKCIHFAKNLNRIDSEMDLCIVGTSMSKSQVIQLFNQYLSLSGD